jgi:hypothetical protein
MTSDYRIMYHCSVTTAEADVQLLKYGNVIRTMPHMLKYSKQVLTAPLQDQRSP